MVLLDLIGFLLSSLVLIRAADYALKSIIVLQKSMNISSFIVSFFLIGLVSAFPEGFVSIVSAFEGVPKLGFGALIGSVIADLTIVLGLVGIVAGRSKLARGFRHEIWLMGLLILPVILALDGVITRTDGLILIGACLMFFYNLLQKRNILKKITSSKGNHNGKQFAIFLASSAMIFLSAHYVVAFSKSIAIEFGLSLLVVGLIFIALSTSLPELVFALTAAKKKLADVAVGQIIGVVVIDATLLIGIVALITPITIEGVDLSKIGVFVATSLALAMYFLRKGRIFTWKDGIVLVFIYVLFVITEFTSIPAA